MRQLADLSMSQLVNLLISQLAVFGWVNCHLLLLLIGELSAGGINILAAGVADGGGDTCLFQFSLVEQEGFFVGLFKETIVNGVVLNEIDLAGCKTAESY